MQSHACILYKRLRFEKMGFVVFTLEIVENRKMSFGFSVLRTVWYLLQTCTGNGGGLLRLFLLSHV